MEEYTRTGPATRRRRFGELILAALLGALMVLGSMPFLLPYMLPEQQDITQQPRQPWEFERDYPSLPDLEHQQTAVVESVNSVIPAVVGVTRFSQTRDLFGRPTAPQPTGSGSGVVISPDGYIITNYHVVEDALSLVITCADGEELDAEVIGTDPGTDLAVLKVDAEPALPWADLGDSDELTVGEFVIAIGNPGGMELERSTTFGVVSATDRNFEVYDWVFGLIQTDAAINPGNSGGPLVNMRGEVVGINSAKIIDAEGLGFSIPSNLVMDITEQLIENGEVVRPMLGVTISEVTSYLADVYNLASDYGLLVVEVTPGGPAQRAGLTSDDIILAVEGKRVESLRDLRQIISSRRVGDEVEVTVQRDEEQLDFTLTLVDLDVN